MLNRLLNYGRFRGNERSDRVSIEAAHEDYILFLHSHSQQRVLRLPTDDDVLVHGFAQLSKVYLILAAADHPLHQKLSSRAVTEMLLRIYVKPQPSPKIQNFEL